MPDVQMDEEQLVGAVTHMIGDKQVLIYMEQALARVVESKHKIKTLDKEAKDIQAQVDKGHAALKELEATTTAKVAEIDRALHAYRVKEMATIDAALTKYREEHDHIRRALVQDHEAALTQKAAVDQAIATGRETLAHLSESIASHQAAVLETAKAKEQAEAELKRVERLIEHIKGRY